jgi:quercetin 2,3-dioxygenase
MQESTATTTIKQVDNHEANPTNFTLRASKARGYGKRDWLESYHSFSFADYYDCQHMHFSVLRVINEDVIAPQSGFGMHPHNDMEIITYMLSGALRHEDSLGNGSVIKAGDVQRMTAGTGIVHSEVNASATEAAHLLQIWLMPDQLHLAPGYEEKQFDAQSKANQWRLIASKDGREGSLTVNQDLSLFASVLDAEHDLKYSLNAGRTAYLQVAKGQLIVNGQILSAGDALMFNLSVDAQLIDVQAISNAELLLFDLPKDPRQS